MHQSHTFEIPPLVMGNNQPVRKKKPDGPTAYQIQVFDPQKNKDGQDHYLETQVLKPIPSRYTYPRKGRKMRPLLTFKVLYFDRRDNAFRKQSVKGRSISAIVFKYKYLNHTYQRRSRSDLRHPMCRVCGERRPCRGGNTTQMLRHIRTFHPCLERILERIFNYGDTNKLHYINLCQDLKKKQEQLILAAKNLDRNEFIKQVFVEKDVDNSKTLNPSHPTQQHYEHQEQNQMDFNIFNDFPQNIAPSGLIKIEGQYNIKMEEQNSMIPQDEQLPNYKIQEPRNSYNLQKIENNSYQQVFEAIQYKKIRCYSNQIHNDEVNLIGSIYYTQNTHKELFKGGQLCDSMLLMHIPYSAEEIFSQQSLYIGLYTSLLYFIVQDQNGNPAICAVIAFKDLSRENNHHLFKQFSQKIANFNSWPQKIVYCGPSQTIHCLKGLIMPKQMENCLENNRQIILLPQDLFRCNGRRNNIRYLASAALLNLRQQMKKSYQNNFIGFILSTGFLIKIVQKIKYLMNSCSTLKDYLSKILRNNPIISEDFAYNEISNQYLKQVSNWLNIEYQIFKMNRNTLQKDLKGFQKFLMPKILKKVGYLYTYAKYSLIMGKIMGKYGQSPYYQVKQLIKDNLWARNKLYTVKFNEKAGFYQCQCELSKIIGLPCAHQIKVIMSNGQHGQAMSKIKTNIRLLLLKKHINSRWILKMLPQKISELYHHSTIFEDGDQQYSQKRMSEKPLKGIQILPHLNEPVKQFIGTPTAENYELYGIMTEQILWKLLYEI